MLAFLKKRSGIIGVVMLALAMAGCAHGPKGRGDVPAQPIEAVLKAHTDSLMAIPGVVGTAQSLCGGKDCIQVYVVDLTPELEKKLPRNLEGYAVDVQVTGAFRALPKN